MVLPNSQSMPSSSSGGPRHASHMAPIFTEQWATEHRLLEEKQVKDALQLSHSQKAKQTVYIYVWGHVSYFLVYLWTFVDDFPVG